MESPSAPPIEKNAQYPGSQRFANLLDLLHSSPQNYAQYHESLYPSIPSSEENQIELDEQSSSSDEDDEEEEELAEKIVAQKKKFKKEFRTNDRKYVKKKSGAKRLAIKVAAKTQRYEIDPVTLHELDHEEDDEAIFAFSKVRQTADEAAKKEFDLRERAYREWDGSGVMPKHPSDYVPDTSFSSRAKQWLAETVESMHERLHFAKKNLDEKVFFENDTNGVLKKITTPCEIKPELSELLARDSALNLQKDLKCDSLRTAFRKKIDLRALRKCELPEKQYFDERINISDLQKFHLTLYDANQTLQLSWQSLLKMGLRNVHFARQTQWFDVHALADCIAMEQADLISDTGFCVDDIFRLQCRDLEMAQLNFSFDDFVDRMGMSRKEFRALPWFLETMVDLLGLQKKHLVEGLKLQKQDYKELVLHRGWLRVDMINLLGFTEQELDELEFGLSYDDVEKEKKQNLQRKIQDVLQTMESEEIENEDEEEKIRRMLLNNEDTEEQKIKQLELFAKAADRIRANDFDVGFVPPDCEPVSVEVPKAEDPLIQQQQQKSIERYLNADLERTTPEELELFQRAAVDTQVPGVPKNEIQLF